MCHRNLRCNPRAVNLTVIVHLLDRNKSCWSGDMLWRSALLHFSDPFHSSPCTFAYNQSDRYHPRDKLHWTEWFDRGHFHQQVSLLNTTHVKHIILIKILSMQGFWWKLRALHLFQIIMIIFIIIIIAKPWWLSDMSLAGYGQGFVIGSSYWLVCCLLLLISSWCCHCLHEWAQSVTSARSLPPMIVTLSRDENAGSTIQPDPRREINITR